MTRITARQLPSSEPDNPISSRISSQAWVSLASPSLSVRLPVSYYHLSFELEKLHIIHTDGMAPFIDSFTISAVAQDDFSDVQVPDAPTQPPHTPNAGVEKPVTEAVLNQERANTKARI